MPVLTLEVLAATWPREYSIKVGGEGTTDSPMAVDSDLDVDMCSSSASSPKSGTGGADNPKASTDSVVDLSGLDLSSTNLLNMLRDRPTFSRLDISNNKCVDKAALSQILKEHRLEWLNIDGCSVSKEDLADLLKDAPSLFRGVETIIHPAFLSLENLVGKESGIRNAFRVYYGAQQGIRGTSGWVSLPFFGIDQLVQNLTDFIEIHERVSFVELPSHTNLGSILGSSYREDGQSWAARGVQTIPTNSECGNFLDGYSFMFFAAENSWNVGNDARLRGFNYGIVLPDGKKEVVDIGRFFEHLKQEGWPKAKNEEAVKRLLEKFNEDTGPVLLKDIGAALREIRIRSSW